jgi:hypothetical protein
MTTPDRTEELIRAMLERRSEAPVPAWLADRTMHAVTTARQVKRGWRGRLAPPTGTGARLVLEAAFVAALLALTGGALVAGGLIDLPGEPEASAPAVVVGPGERPSASAPAPEASSAAEPTPPPSLAPPPTARTVPDALVPDTVAVVTKDGFDLRVRSAPGTGADSKELQPLLQSGTWMLIVSGPVPADGYDWYEILVDPEQENLYGWVAAAGKDGVAWIKPKAPACPAILDEAALIEMSRLDYLVCYGDSEVEVVASRIEPMPIDDTPCLSVGADACTVEPAWMNAPIWLGLDVGEGETSGLRSVAPPDVYARAKAVPAYTPVVLTLAADQPAARECRFLDSAGEDLVPPGRAALACRMQLVVLDLAWDEPGEGVGTEPVDEPVADTLAAVNVAYIEAWSAPAGEPVSRQPHALKGT